ncbi:MAG: prepilin-type N-terminal cleavage/methylation domain-containing protein [Pseudomonadota bacterium]
MPVSFKREIRRLTDGKKGFTLFELILSLTILAVLLVLIFGALRLGARAWERGERDLSLDQQERIVLDMVRHQVASWHYFDENVPAGDESLKTAGSADRLGFFSLVSLVPGRGYPPVYVIYRVVTEKDDTQSLYLFERSTVLATMDEILSQSGDPGSFFPLIQGMEQITMDYWVDDPQSGSTQWQEQWSPVDGGTMLRAVRLSFYDGRSQSPLSMIVRIRVDHEK